MNNVWIATDWHLYSRDDNSHHPFRSRHNLGKLSDQLAQSIQEDDLFIFLGDLCDPDVSDPKVVEAIVRSIPCHRIMCRGNHDIQDDAFYTEAGFHQVCDIVKIHNIIFSHKPVRVAPDEINIHGHLHTEKMSTLGYQHINAYASNWNDNDAPVLLDDLLASSTVQEVDISEREAAHIQEKFEKYTSFDNDHYSNILDLTDDFPLCPIDEGVTLTPQKDFREGDLRLSQICEFNKSMGVFVYGLAINGRIDKRRNTTYKDWDKYYRLASPEQFVRQGGGQCWDFVTYEASVFERDFKDISYNAYYVMFNIAPDFPTHTFIIFHHKGYHYLFEMSFHWLSGITRSKSVDDLISCQLTHLAAHSSLHTPYELMHCPRYICTYNPLDPNIYGMDCMEFMNYMAEVGIEYNLKYKEVYDVTKVYPFVEAELTESADTIHPQVLYHGTSQKLTELKPHVSTHGASYVYSSPSKTFALAYAGEQWDDFDMMQGSINGVEYLAEVVPGAFDRVFSKPAYLYELPVDTFTKLNQHEWVSTEAVKPTKCTKVGNALDELKRSGVKIYRYPTLPPHIKDRDAYIDDKCATFGISRYDIKDRLQLLGEAADDVLDEILFDDPENTKLWLADDEKWQDKTRKAQEKQADTAGVAIDEAAFGKMTLYHGSDKKFDTLKPVAPDFGNLFQKPGWSVFCWDDHEMAVNWALYVTLRRPRHEIRDKYNYNGEDVMFRDNDKLPKKMLISKEYAELVYKYTQSGGMSAYVYSFDVSPSEVGLGNDSTKKEFTVRREIADYSLEEIKITPAVIKRYCEIVPNETITQEKSTWGTGHKAPDLFRKVIMIRDYGYQYQHNKEALDLIFKSGELKPGEDIEAFLAAHGKTLMVKPLRESSEEVVIRKGINRAYPEEDQPHTTTLAEREKHKQALLQYIRESATPKQKTITLSDTEKKELRMIIDGMSNTERDYVGNGYFINHFNIHYLDIRKVSGKPAGFAVLVTRKDGPKAFVIIGVSPDARGKGLAKSMLSGLITYAKDFTDFDVIEYNVDAGNTASEQLATSCGLTKLDSDDKEETHFQLVINEDAAETHSLDRESKSDVAERYGLRNVGNTHDIEKQEEAEEKKRKLDRRKKERLKNLERGRRTQKRNRFIKKVKSHLPGVKNEEADAVDGSDAEYLEGPPMEKDMQGRLVRRPYDIQNDLTESFCRLIPRDKVTFFDRIDEATLADKVLHPVYVIIMHTGTMLANVIKGATGAEFSHSSISFDSNMDKLYSFARRGNDSLFNCGFTMENLHSKFFTERKVHYAIYVVPCTKEQIAKMRKRLDYFIEHASKFTYDVTGLVTNFFKIPNNPENRWFCSRFVADILNSGNPSAPLIDEPSLTRPEDFKSTNFAYFITGGDDLNKLSKKKIDTATKRLFSQLKIKDTKINENTVLDLYPNNPWARQVLNYQLTKMDEGAVDGFIQYLKSFKLRFDKEGNIIVTRREFDQLDQHFRNSLRMIKTYEAAGNVNGVKDELCRIHYMTTLISEYYLRPHVDVKNLRPNTKDVRKDMLDLRSVMLNAFKQHLKWVSVRDPRWNFNSYYASSVYGSDFKIPQKVITGIGHTIITALS